MIFDDLKRNIDQVRENLDALIVKEMQNVSAEVIDINIRQLEEGIARDGGILGEYESDEYAEFKQSIGSKAPHGIVDTKLEGDFHAGFYTEEYIGNSPGQSGLFIDSTDEKAGKLESRYPGIYGIAPENEAEFVELFIDYALNKIADEITNIN